MPRIRPTKAKRRKRAAITRIPGRPTKPSPKLAGNSRRAAADIGEIVRNRAEAEAAIAEARKSDERLRDTIRVGVERGDYPEAIGREEEWIAERLARLHQPGGRHEQTLADGRCILIEERLTDDGGIIGLRVDITELKQREASFRLLFDSNPVPMIVCALDDERILGVNDAAIEHYGYRRAEFENLTIRSLQAFEIEPPWHGDHSTDELTA